MRTISGARASLIVVLATSLSFGLTVAPATAGLRDLELASVDSDEKQRAYASYSASLSSEDGRYVLFNSNASDLDGVRPSGNSGNVYLRDRVEGTTRIVTAGPGGVAFGGRVADLTPDGRHVLVLTDSAVTPDDVDQREDLYLHDRVRGSWELASTVDTGDGPFLGDGSVADDGRHVAFTMNAHRPDKHGRQVYVRDLDARRTELVSITRSGRPASANSAHLSGNGRFVAFRTRNDDLVRRDTNRVHDAFVRDLRTRRTERVSVSSSGRQANRQATAIRISADGRVVTWETRADNVVRKDTNRGRDLFQHNRRNDRTRRVTLTDRDRQVPVRSIIEEVSRSGRYVAFRTQADLGGPSTESRSWDVYVRDVRTGRTRFLTRDTAYGPWTLSDQKYATFTATRPLIPEDDNGGTDVYIGRFR